MLLDNFKLLISFYRNAQFTDTAGNSIAKISFLGGQNGQVFGNHNNTSEPIVNNHCVIGALSYNYDITSEANSYTDEQTAYTWMNITNSSSSNRYDISNERYNGFILFAGTGNTPAAASDYKLDNAVILDSLSASCTHNEDGRTIVTRTFQNNTGENVTIKEIGLYVFKSVSSQNNYTSRAVMIGRKVLNTPVTLAEGECYTFTYVIDMSRISFEEADE